MRSEIGVLPRELASESGEDKVDVSPVLIIPRAEERSSELPVRKNPFRDRLCDSSFARSSQSVQPIDLRCGTVPDPILDLIEDDSAGPLQTSLAIAMSKLGPERRGKTVENSCFICERFKSGIYH